MRRPASGRPSPPQGGGALGSSTRLYAWARGAACGRCVPGSFSQSTTKEGLPMPQEPA
jgi:hypothetical protein